ncbi:MAG TPA: PAS domain-containing protein [Flavihumibacter sp.]|nr:PAS domain-containing protein [Bacteroidota bacterium]HQD08207.1 PAS domain-containing protein [Flavihumibacter sp.]
MVTGEDSTVLRGLRSLWASGEKDENQLHSIADLFPDLVYVYEVKDKKLRYINRRIQELLGFDQEEVSGWEDKLNRLVFKDDLPLVEEELNKYSLLQDENSHSYNCRLNSKAGEFRYFKTTGTVLRRDAEGRPESMLFMAQDISVQVKMEQEKLALLAMLAENERMLHSGVWNMDLVNNTMDWSDGMYAMMGYNREEQADIDADWFWEQVYTADISQLKATIAQSIETGETFETVYSLTRKDGSRLFVETIGKATLNAAGKVVKISATSRDISDQYLQNLEYQANKQLLAQTEQMLNYGIFVWDLVKNEISWSAGLYDIFDVAAEDRVDLIAPDWFYAHVLEEDREILRHTVLDAVAAQRGFECEYSIITDKGVVKNVISRANLVMDDNRLPVRMMGNTHDITQVKKVENELKRNLRELKRSNTELEEFAYAASHDLQEPLRKITTFGSRFKHKYGDLVGSEGQMYIDRMQTASDSMRVLIDNLLDLSRVTRADHMFEPVDLGKLVRLAQSDLEILIDESKASIVVADLPVVEGIPTQLRQMFTNLLSNALKFAKLGTMPLIEISGERLGRREMEEHFLVADKTYFRIDVKDNGIGFDQEYEEKIFQIFQRLHGKSDYPGSGIGLSICKRIAERHQGLISATGKTGEGAVFSIILPENQ